MAIVGRWVEFCGKPIPVQFLVAVVLVWAVVAVPTQQYDPCCPENGWLA
jgi:hypothetical protein